MLHPEYQDFLSAESKKPYFKELINSLKLLKASEFRPEKHQIFRAFELHPLSELKVVIVGQDPYKDEAAEGLAFSCANNLLRPSLANIFKELKSTHSQVTLSSTSLESWGRQGVLLLNAYLTTSLTNDLNHGSLGWAEFANSFFGWINDVSSGIIFVFLGRFAQNFAHLINSEKHYKIILSHPSPFSANISFLGSKLFLKIDEILAKKHKKINWNT